MPRRLVLATDDRRVRGTLMDSRFSIGSRIHEAADLPAADRPAILAAAKAFDARISAEAPKQDAESVATMKTRGLTVTTAS